MFAIRFYASNDAKGNERSVYIVCDDDGFKEPTGNIQQWLVANLPSGLAEEFIARITHVEVTPIEYQRMRRFKRQEVDTTIQRRGPRLTTGL